MRPDFDPLDDEPKIDSTMQFYVFMLVFWPSALILGLIDFVFIPEYDLRPLTLLLALLSGWIGVLVYRSRERRKGEAS